MDVKDEVRAAIDAVRENGGRPPVARPLADSANLQDELELDSLDLAELVARLDARFGVDVFAAGPVWTVGEVVARIGTP